MKSIILLLSICIFCLSCNPEKGAESSSGPIGKMISHSDCKNDIQISENKIPNNQSCIEYNYFGSTLKLIHFNAGFNCCPGKINAEVIINAGIISIVEKEEQASCDCNCLYDLDFEIKDLPKGVYQIIIDEQYWKFNHNKINFYIDLNKITNDTYCVERLNYPWNLPE